MDASLAVSCIDMPRTGSVTRLPYHLFSQLSGARQQEIRNNYNNRLRQRDHTLAFQLDPNFRIYFPSDPILSFDTLLPPTDQTTVPMDANVILQNSGTELLPSINDTVYVDPVNANRTFQSLLTQYETEDNGVPPKYLTPQEYLAYLKKSNKALDAAVSVLNSKIIKSSLQINKYFSLTPRTGAATAAVAAAQDAPTPSVTKISSSINKLQLLYNNTNLKTTHSFEFEGYLALGYSPSLIESISEVARKKLAENEVPTLLEFFIFSLRKMAPADIIRLLLQFNSNPVD